jgi:hypothetical protein
MMSDQRKVVVKNSPELAEEFGAADAAKIGPEEMLDQTVAEKMEEAVADEAVSVEDLPDDELIWPGGPNAAQIKLWKREYGDVYVTSITYDKHVAWRTLNRLEYKNLMKKMGQLVQAGQLTDAEASLWNEEAIAEICILYPAFDKQSLVSEMAGLPSLIAQEVLEASGFSALEVRQL